MRLNIPKSKQQAARFKTQDLGLVAKGKGADLWA